MAIIRSCHRLRPNVRKMLRTNRSMAAGMIPLHIELINVAAPYIFVLVMVPVLKEIKASWHDYRIYRNNNKQHQQKRIK
jgi:hypothetical protein